MATVTGNSPFIDGLTKMAEKLSLTDEQFEELSQKAERELKDAPSVYDRNVIVMAGLGYLFIFSVIALLVGLLFMVINWTIHAQRMNYGSIKLLLLLGLLLWIIFKALWIKQNPPQGIELKKIEAPRLFDMLDELSRKLNTRVDVVLVDDEYNAAVRQVPTAGFLDLHRNYLMLGLPLMMSQSPEQFKSVLAHELGHLSGNHSKSKAWIYNLRIRWLQLLDTIQKEAQPFFFAPFYLFFSWFTPRFSAYTLALARAHELEADSAAVAIVGPKAFSESMLLLPLHAHFLSQSFWPKKLDSVKHEAAPPERVYNDLQHELSTFSHDGQSIEEILKGALNEKGSGADTHPPLKTRLTAGHFTPLLKLNEDGLPDMNDSASAALLAEVSKPISKAESAADFYLGTALDEVIGQLNKSYSEQLQESWQWRHEFLQATLKRLEEIENELKDGPKIELLREKCNLVGDSEGVQACWPILEQILELDPDDSPANFRLGLKFIGENDERGVPLLEKAIALNPLDTGSACTALIAHFKEKGDEASAAKFKKQLEEHEEELKLARKERNAADGKSVLLHHTLDDATIEYLRNVFKELKDINQVWVANKQVQYFPDSPYVIMGIEAFDGSIEENSEDKLAIAQFLLNNLEMPYEFCVSVFELGSGALRKNLEKTPGSLIYQKRVHGKGK